MGPFGDPRIAPLLAHNYGRGNAMPEAHGPVPSPGGMLTMPVAAVSVPSAHGSLDDHMYDHLGDSTHAGGGAAAGGGGGLEANCDVNTPVAASSPPPVPTSDRRRFHRNAGVVFMGALLADSKIMEVADVRSASSVELSLARANAVLSDLLDAHEVTPPTHILTQTARLRRGLERIGRRAMQNGHIRDMQLLAGKVAVLGADATFKLGDADGARALTAQGFAAGIAAGDGPLCGTAREVGAVVEFYDGQPEEALRLARDGLHKAGSGPVGARLVCQEARALAALGDVRGAAGALDSAYDIADDIPAEKWGRPGPSFDTFNPVEVAYNATTALCLLGRPAAAREHAEFALPKLDRMDAPGFRSVIRLDLALALARSGRLELEQACALAGDAIEISWGRVVASVSSRADELLRVTRSHGEVPAVRELAALVREWQRSAANPHRQNASAPQPQPQPQPTTTATPTSGVRILRPSSEAHT